MQNRLFGNGWRLAAGLAVLLMVVHAPGSEPGDQNKAPAELFLAIDRPVDFARDIFPLLEANCFQCHGSKRQRGNLRLDARQNVFTGGVSGEAVLPGNSFESILFQRVAGLGEEEQMPPDGDKLTPEQIGLIHAWIEQGAEWPEGVGLDSGEIERHWAYRQPVRPELPDIKLKQWPRNPIDHFVLARLEKEGLKPAPPASRETLIRRVTLDLTGLPPTIEEVDEFLADNRPDAYHRLVERLLGSAHYGERWAGPWLDQARYADTNGYEADNRRSIWPYRDWVIDALNRDLPFDQFIIEQIAGDLLPDATLEQRVATGFHRNTLVNTEGGTDEEEFRVAAVVDRVNTTFEVLMATTISCAQCHNHKYDPISQREYFQVFAFFNQTADQGRNNAPEIPVPTPEQAARLDEIRSQVTPLEKILNTQTPELDRRQKAWEDQLQEARREIAVSWRPLRPLQAEATGDVELDILGDGSLLSTGELPDQSNYELLMETLPGEINAIRLEALIDASLPHKSSGRSQDGNFVLTGFTVETRPADAPEHSPVEPPALGNWFSIGPFYASSMSEAFQKVFGPEEELNLEKTYENGELKWIEQPEFEDGKAHELTGENAATYLYRTITTSSAMPLLISLGSDDGIQVWLNGNKLLAKNVARGVAPGQEFVRLDLRQGKNELLLKINNGAGGYAFYFAVPEDQSRLNQVEFTQAFADYSQSKFDVSSAIDGNPKTGWAIGAGDPALRLNREAVFIPSRPLKLEEGARLVIRLEHQSERKQHLLGRFRLSLSTAPMEAHRQWGSVPSAQRALIALPETHRTSSQKENLSAYYRSIDPKLDKVREQVAELREQKPKNIPTTLVMQEAEKPRTTRILIRGTHLNPGAEVQPGVPSVFHPLPEDAPMNRLTFARWLASPENPLIGRVTMNRLWAHYFGNAFVETSEDFGFQGELPTHPELLDWLATEFIRQEWSLKAMHRLIVSSATYQQASEVTPDLLEKDPFNRLLVRGPRFRMEAEMIRDNALAVSGLLNRKIGGPSVFPYQPDGIWNSPYNQDRWSTAQDGGQFRRGLYTFWKRSAPYASFMAFDAPTREVSCERRPRSNTPLQALITLNDPAFFAAANGLALQIIHQGGATPLEKMSYAFRRTVARKPAKDELDHLMRLHQSALEQFRENPEAARKLMAVGMPQPTEADDPAELAAWSVISNVLLNLDETLTKG